MKKFLLRSITILVVLGAISEIGLRLAGVLDFPIYDTDPEIGYIPAPNQHGSYLRKNDWIVNEKSQGTSSWQPEGTKDLLLIGDSLVWGGNTYRADEKLGAQLEKAFRSARLDYRVWPAGAGGWNFLNEVVYFQRYPEVIAATDRIVWIVNSEDFGPRALWHSDTILPRQRPWCAIEYAFTKFVLPRYFPEHADPAAVPLEDTAILPEAVEALRTTVQALHRQAPARSMLFVLYPKRHELGADSSYDRFKKTLKTTLAGSGAEVLEIRENPRWLPEYYKDDGIHPLPEGYRILSDIIAAALTPENTDSRVPILDRR